MKPHNSILLFVVILCQHCIEEACQNWKCLAYLVVFGCVVVLGLLLCCVLLCFVENQRTILQSMRQGQLTRAWWLLAVNELDHAPTIFYKTNTPNITAKVINSRWKLKKAKQIHQEPQLTVRLFVECFPLMRWAMSHKGQKYMWCTMNKIT